MRGSDMQTAGLFSYVSCEARVPTSHPLRAIRAIVDEALEVLSPDFEAMYSAIGRPSIPPEKLLRALLLQAFYVFEPSSQDRRKNRRYFRDLLNRPAHNATPPSRAARQMAPDPVRRQARPPRSLIFWPK